MSIMIGLPCYGGNVSDKTTMSLFNLGKLLVRNNIDHSILVMANESLITKGRSKIANFFLNNTKNDYLFFLDSDIGFDPNDVLKMLSYQKEIVCGAYPMKTIPLKWNYTLVEPIKKENTLVAIEKIGIGFSLIHRSVFAKIKERYKKELKYVPSNESIGHKLTEEEKNNSYHFFAELKHNDNYYPEDLSFFMRAKKCGVESWLDTSIQLSHVGSHVFTE